MATRLAGMSTDNAYAYGVTPDQFSQYGELVDLLYEAIPQEEEDRLSSIALQYSLVNGGTHRGWSNKEAAVCTYNNTISSEEEIVAWYQRAYELAATKQGGTV